MRAAGMLGALLVLAGAAPASGAAASGARQRVSVRSTTRRPGASMGITVSASYSDGRTPSGHALPLRHVSDGLPSGTLVATRRVARCVASDLELMLLGPSACPAASRVGSGSVVLDLGLPGGLGQVPAQVTLINSASGEILFVGREPRTGVALVDHGVLRGSAIEIDIPRVPGLGDQMSAWVVREQFSITAASGLLRAPATCPRSRAWIFRRGHTYSDGVTQTTRSRLPCDRPRRRR